MRILITGADGYIGWPLTVSLLKNKRIKQIVCVDNLVRRKWLREVKSNSAIKIASLKSHILILLKSTKMVILISKSKNRTFCFFEIQQ